MNKHLLPGDPPHCPNCKREQDGAFGGSRMPQQGDYCVCFYCATISCYEVADGAYTIRQATEQDIDRALQEGILAQLYVTRDYIKFKIKHEKTINDDW